MESIYDVPINCSTLDTATRHAEGKPTSAPSWWSTVCTTVSSFFKCGASTTINVIDAPVDGARKSTLIDEQPAPQSAPIITITVLADEPQTSAVSDSLDLPTVPFGITAFKSMSDAINSLGSAPDLKVVPIPTIVSSQRRFVPSPTLLSPVLDATTPLSIPSPTLLSPVQDATAAPSSPSTPASFVFELPSPATSCSSLASTSEEQSDKRSYIPQLSLVLYQPNQFIEAYNKASKVSINADEYTASIASMHCLSTSVPTTPPFLSLRDFDVFEQIGAGSYGDIYLARWKASKLPVALKVVRLVPVDEDGGEEDIDESQIQMRAKHMLAEKRVLRSVVGEKGMLQLLASWRDSTNFYFVTELCQSGDASQLIQAHGKVHVKTVQFIMAHMIVTLEKLQEKRIIHHDIKPDNILLDAAGIPRLADFGLAEQLAEGNDECISGSPGMGTMRYLPPDLYLMQPQSFDKDCWALAVSMYEMLIGDIPFGSDEMSLADMGRAIVQDELVFPPPRTELHAFGFHLLSQMLDKDPGFRPSFEEIKNHCFFADIDFTTIQDSPAPEPRYYHYPIAVHDEDYKISILEGEPLNLKGEADDFAYMSPEMATAPSDNWSDVPLCGRDSIVYMGEDYDGMTSYNPITIQDTASSTSSLSGHAA